MNSSGNRIGTWFRVGRRFEYSILVLSIAWFLVIGLMLTWGEPPNTPLLWVFWVYAGIPPLIMTVLAFVFGPHVRRNAEKAVSSRSGPPKLAARLGFYLLLLVAAVMTWARISKIPLERHVAATPIVHFLFWDLAILAVVIGLNELSIWRKTKRAPR